MQPWKRWLYLAAALAALIVGIGVVVQAVRQDSWGPISEVGWLPAVIVAAMSPGYRRCKPGRRRPAE